LPVISEESESRYKRRGLSSSPYTKLKSPSDDPNIHVFPEDEVSPINSKENISSNLGTLNGKVKQSRMDLCEASNRMNKMVTYKFI
jgi:hypothetical protein